MLAVTLLADQLLEKERTNCAPAATHHGSVGGGGSSRPVAAARLSRVQGWHASPHGGTCTLCTSAAAARLTRLAMMPRLAWYMSIPRRMAAARQRTPRTAAEPRVPSKLISATMIQLNHIHDRIRDQSKYKENADNAAIGDVSCYSRHRDGACRTTSKLCARGDSG